MDSELLDRIQRMQLMTEEDEAITVRPIMRKEILEEYSLSLIGNFLTTSDLKVVEMGDGLRQFKFSMESQLN